MKNYNFDKPERIGKGGFGQVYKVKCLLDNKYYAMKEQIFEDENYRRAAERELAILQRMEHENILKYKDSFWHN